MATILVVDDDTITRLVIKTMINNHGHVVLEAENGAIGQMLFGHVHIDLLFVDIYMPEQDGIETIHNIRKQTKLLPIVAMTASDPGSSKCYMRHARLLGATKTFQKPLLAIQVQEALALILPKQALPSVPSTLRSEPTVRHCLQQGAGL